MCVCLYSPRAVHMLIRDIYFLLSDVDFRAKLDSPESSSLQMS